MSVGCVFCRILAGETPGEILYEDDLVTAIQDSRPVAPVHILIVPNQHITSMNEVNEQHQSLLGHMLLVAKKLAHRYGVQDSGYRLVLNTGPEAGQSVFHLHLHIIAGRSLAMKLKI